MSIKISSFFCICGPSGAGKTSITDALKERYRGVLGHPISYTTRQPRDTEKHGRDYYFIDDKKFNKMVLDGEFLAYANVYGKMYGTSREEVVQSLNNFKRAFVIFNPSGAEQLKLQGFPATYVGIIPPNLKALSDRLVARGGTNNLTQRLSEAKLDLSYAQEQDYVIINDELEDAIVQLERIMGLC